MNAKCVHCSRKLTQTDNLAYFSSGTGFCLVCANRRAASSSHLARKYLQDWEMRARHAEEAAFMDDFGEMSPEDDYSEDSYP